MIRFYLYTLLLRYKIRLIKNSIFDFTDFSMEIVHITSNLYTITIDDTKRTGQYFMFKTSFLHRHIYWVGFIWNNGDIILLKNLKSINRIRKFQYKNIQYNIIQGIPLCNVYFIHKAGSIYKGYTTVHISRPFSTLQKAQQTYLKLTLQ